MKDVWADTKIQENKINKKKIIITAIIILLIVLTIVIIGVYYTNRQAREWIDKNIFRKEVLQDKVTTI